ncbi:tail fiber domain-containing protein [Lacihabitans sp. LS3-19]|uniref:tail fiber domain-containing protein n=1 Tax=Lacihabitans sp. LS3-19 TaxID=2487335 RepID=UPI0020CE3771|nr:tail fiber domain-containing protein [Lacihabitans sp. LS3-19]MCP9767153.1 tail fiber domain-containing protein [Lacihabitans sp. LS3-19]
MKIALQFLLTLSLTFFLSLRTFAQSEIILIDSTNSITITPSGLLYADNILGSAHVRLGEGSQAFRKTYGTNVSAGYHSLYKLDSAYGPLGGLYNVAIGSKSMENSYAPYSSTAIGFQSLQKNTTGQYHSALGSNSLQYNEIRQGHSALGAQTVNRVDGGFGTTAVGYFALNGPLLTTSDSDFEVAIGAFANAFADPSDENTYLGAFSGYSRLGLGNALLAGHQSGLNTKGSLIGIGSQAAQNLLESGLIAIGKNAFKTQKSGGRDIALGAFVQENVNSNAAIQNVLIGNNIGIQNSGTLILDSKPIANNVNTLMGSFAYDRVMINATEADLFFYTNALVVIGEASKNTPGDWIGHSDLRLKTNISPLSADLTFEKLKALQGISYQRKDKEPGKTEMGFTAQNIQEQFSELVVEDPRGYLQTSYGSMTAILTEAIKALENKLIALENYKEEIKNLKAKLNTP